MDVNAARTTQVKADNEGGDNIEDLQKATEKAAKEDHKDS